MVKQVGTRLILYICYLVLFSAGCAVCLLQEAYLWAAGTFLGVVVTGAGLVRLYLNNLRKITFLFNAIENNDYTFHFPESGNLFYERLFNASLNRIKSLLVKAKNEAIEQEKYYELILSHVITGVVVVNERGNVVQSNAEALRLLGVSILTHIQQLSRVEESLPTLMKELSSGQNTSLSLHNERGNTNLTLQASAVMIHGQPLKIIAINDIDRQLEEKELESWISLTRVLTHEIMNAITPITSLSDTLLQMQNEQESELRSGLEVIHTTGEGLIAFVESYRNFARISAPQMKLIQVRPLLERLMRLVQEEASTQGVELQLDVETDELMMQADENQVAQVILNLLKNGLAALKDGAARADEQPRIHIRALCEVNEYVIIEVSNNGTPISPEVAEHIFIPFFTTKPHGSGIGLSVSRQIMRLHHGSIKLKASTPHLTTFALTFR